MNFSSLKNASKSLTDYYPVSLEIKDFKNSNYDI